MNNQQIIINTLITKRITICNKINRPRAGGKYWEGPLVS